MEFLKRHYEKVILLGLFVLFIVLMIMLQGVVSRTKEISDADLNLPKLEANYVMADEKNKMFDPSYIWNETKMVWNDGVAREEEGGSKVIGFSDLVSVFPMASCPYCNDPLKSDKLTLVPLSNFSSKKTERICPNGDHVLPAPSSTKKMFIGLKSENDLDGDGIPNDIETKFGMNQNDAADAFADNDKDGFSNYFEIQNNFDPNNPGSHPPYWWRLRLKDIARIELPVKFMAMNDDGGSDKSKWVLQFNSPHRRIKNKIRTDFYGIGDEVKIDNRLYRIDDVVKTSGEEKVEIKDGEGKTEIRKVERVQAFLSEIPEPGMTSVPDKLTMILGQPAYSSDKRPVLEDMGIPEGGEKIVYVGSKFYVGNTEHKNLANDTTAGRYRVTGIDMDKRIVKIIDLREKAGEDGNRAEIEITADGRIPAEARVVISNTPAAEDAVE